MPRLRELILTNHWLTGSIPPELGELDDLVTLDLSQNLLTGKIPSELAALKNLSYLNLEGNYFSGCIAHELSDMWVEATALPRCQISGGGMGGTAYLSATDEEW